MNNKTKIGIAIGVTLLSAVGLYFFFKKKKKDKAKGDTYKLGMDEAIIKDNSNQEFIVGDMWKKKYKLNNAQRQKIEQEGYTNEEVKKMMDNQTGIFG